MRIFIKHSLDISWQTDSGLFCLLEDNESIVGFQTREKKVIIFLTDLRFENIKTSTTCLQTAFTTYCISAYYFLALYRFELSQGYVWLPTNTIPTECWDTALNIMSEECYLSKHLKTISDCVVLSLVILVLNDLSCSLSLRRPHLQCDIIAGDRPGR